MPRYLSLKQIGEMDKYPFTKYAAQKIFLKRKENGLVSCCYLFGNKLLVREDLFDKWIEGHNEGAVKEISRAVRLSVEDIPQK